jgi:hypothetical protein
MMSLHRRPSVPRTALLVASLALVACGDPAAGGPSATEGSPPASGLVAPSPAGSRPTSPAVVTITSPKPNESVTGTSVHVVISLQNATIVAATTTDIRSDQGHVHLYVDNVLVSMNYGLEQDLPVQPGTYLLKAEFVAADHAPFNPRVWSPEVIFTVK